MAILKNKQTELVVGNFLLGTSSIDPGYSSGYFDGLSESIFIADAFATISLQMTPLSSSLAGRIFTLENTVPNNSESFAGRIAAIETGSSGKWTGSDGYISRLSDVQITGSLLVSGSFGLSIGAVVTEISTDGGLAGNSDSVIPTERAVKTYIDNQVILTTSGSVIGSGSTGYLALWGSPSTISGSSIFQNSGNIGINILSPAAMLHVLGDISASAIEVSGNINGIDLTVFSSSVANRLETAGSSTDAVSGSGEVNSIAVFDSAKSLTSSSLKFVNEVLQISASLSISGSTSKDLVFQNSSGSLTFISQPTASSAVLVWISSSYYWVEDLDAGLF